jgi:hypothetical protein
MSFKPGLTKAALAEKLKAMLTDDLLFGKGTVPANEALRPLAQSECYLVKK